MTTLTVYFSNEASGTLATANKLYSTSGSPANVNNTSKLGTATGWGEVYAQGTTNGWGAGVTAPSPSGNGFLWDVTTLEGNDLLAGNYTASVRLNMTGSGAVNITSDIHARLYKRSSGGAYTLVADTLLTGQTIKTTKTTFNPVFTTTGRTSFATGDKLYVDILCNVTHNTGPSTATINLNDLSTDTVTHTGMTTAQVVTPGYVTTGGGAGSINPYMVKMGATGTNITFPAQAITDMQTLGVGGLFYQINWSDIDTSGGTAQNTLSSSQQPLYNWGGWDSCIQQCNTAGIDVYLAIMFPPTQLQIGGGNVTANPTYMANFAAQIARAYTNGQTLQRGTRHIKGIYIGNEDYSHGAGGDAPDLVTALIACHPVIKAVSSSIEVVAGGLYIRNSTTDPVWWDTLINPATGAYTGGIFQADSVSFHWHDAQPYTGNYTTATPVCLDPAQSVSSWNGGQGVPTFAATWGFIQTKMNAYGLTGVNVYGDEIGMNINTNPNGNVAAPSTNMSRYPGSVITDAQRGAYFTTILDSMRTSGFCTKIGFFTLSYYKGYPGPNYRDGQSLVQGQSDGTPSYGAANGSFYTIKNYIAAYPTWGAAAASTNLEVSTGTLAFSATITGSDPGSQTVTLTNTGSSSDAYTASTDQSWLSVSPASGTVAGSGGTATSTVSATIAGLAVGTYTGTVTYVGADNTVTVAVTLTISPSSGGGFGTLQPLTVYFTGEAAATLTTANLMYTLSGGVANINNTSKLGAATGWGELTSQGTASAWGAGVTAPSPSGNGWLYDVTTLETNSLIAGAYVAACRLNTAGAGAVTITADIYVRVWKYNATSGLYTAIGNAILLAQTIKTTKQVFAPVLVTTAQTAFGAGDKLYVDFILNVTSNSGGAAQTVQVNDLSTETGTLTGLATEELLTPGYIGTGTSLGGAGTPSPNTILINNNLVMALAGTLQVDSAIGRRSAARFQCRTDTSTHFQQYMPVQVFDAQANLAFNGYISRPRETKPGFQASLVHDIQCIDQHYLADKRIVAASYANKSAGYIAADLFTNYLGIEGVTVGLVYDGPTPNIILFPSDTLYPGSSSPPIPQATFSYVTVAQAMDTLVREASSVGIPFYWMIDQNLEFWFVPYNATINTTIVDGTQIDQVNRPPYVIRGNPLYRNTQYITGGYQQTTQQTEVHIGDGQTRSFTLGYQVSQIPTISVSLNGGGYSVQTVGIKGSTGSQWYYAAGDNIITQDAGQAVLRGPTGTVDNVQVVYYGQYPTVIVDTNAAQVNYMAGVDDSTGIIEAVTNDPTITSLANGLSEASALLTRYARQGTQLIFTTRATGFAPGQLVTVNLPMFNLLNAQMLIESVTMTDQIDQYNFWYTVTAILGPYDTTWVAFFSSLLQQQTTPNSINIGVGASVPLTANFTATVAPSASLTVTVLSCPLPNTSQNPATNLYPC